MYAVSKIVTGCLITKKVAIFALSDKKVVLSELWKYGTLSIYVMHVSNLSNCIVSNQFYHHNAMLSCRQKHFEKCEKSQNQNFNGLHNLNFRKYKIWEYF